MGNFFSSTLIVNNEPMCTNATENIKCKIVILNNGDNIRIHDTSDQSTTKSLHTYDPNIKQSYEYNDTTNNVFITNDNIDHNNNNNVISNTIKRVKLGNLSKITSSTNTINNGHIKHVTTSHSCSPIQSQPKSPLHSHSAAYRRLVKLNNINDNITTSNNTTITNTITTTYDNHTHTDSVPTIYT
jgi:hypothetical protein